MTRVQIDRSATVALATAPGQRLRADAAAAFDQLNEAYRKKYGQHLVLTDSFRPLEVQVRILKERYTTNPFFSTRGLTVANGGIRYYEGRTWYRKPGQATVATPGYSNHGSGIAVDISGTGGFAGTVYKRLAKLAPKHGFTNTEGRAIGESWHWGFTGKPAKARKRKPKRLRTTSRSRRRLPRSKWSERLAQRALRELRFYTGRIDGDFGPASESATRAFQRSRGLQADGVIGPKTWYELARGASLGESGVYVEVAQRVMGFTGSKVDGKHGPATDVRAKDVQRWLGVTTDGDWGNTTITNMRKKG